MVETIQQAGRSQHAGDGDWYALLGYGGSRSAGIVLRFLTSLRYVRNDKKRESRGFAARKSVPKCSILFRFVCGPRTVRNEIGALLKHKWTRMNRFWNDGRRRRGHWYRSTGAAGRGGEGATTRVAGSVHGGIVARTFVEIKAESGFSGLGDAQDCGGAVRVGVIFQG